MATVNLGRIKPVFRGAYSGGTAYVVDDIVTSANETYICIQAHGAGTQAVSQAAYWTKLAAKGTDGTDVGTTITTQGDILYRDGSGLQRLAKPASDMYLKNTSAGAVQWAALSSDWVKVTGGTHSSAAYLDMDNIFTADYSHYKVYVYASDMGNYLRFQLRSGGASGTTATASEYRYVTNMYYRNSSGRSDTGEHGWNQSSMRIGWQGTDNSEKTQAIEMHCTDPYSNTIKFVAGGLHYFVRNGEVGFANFGCTNDTAASTRWTGLRIYQEGNGNWTGKYAVYGLKI